MKNTRQIYSIFLKNSDQKEIQMIYDWTGRFSNDRIA